MMGPANCHWTEDRWHLGARGIHAGESMWFRVAMMWGEFDEDSRRPKLGPGPWRRVRVESFDSGRALTAHLLLDDIEWTVRLTEEHELAWEIDGPGQCSKVAPEGSGARGTRCRLEHEHAGAHVYGWPRLRKVEADEPRRPRPTECYCGSSTRDDGFPCVRGECPMGPVHLS